MQTDSAFGGLQPGYSSIDAWRIVINVAAENLTGLKKALKWLNVFASSGVDIPVTTFLQISGLARDLNATFEDYVVLCETVFAAIWIKSFGRQGLQILLTDFVSKRSEWILEELWQKHDAATMCAFLFPEMGFSTIYLHHQIRFHTSLVFFLSSSVWM